MIEPSAEHSSEVLCRQLLANDAIRSLIEVAISREHDMTEISDNETAGVAMRSNIVMRARQQSDFIGAYLFTSVLSEKVLCCLLQPTLILPDNGGVYTIWDMLIIPSRPGSIAVLKNIANRLSPNVLYEQLMRQVSDASVSTFYEVVSEGIRADMQDPDDEQGDHMAYCNTMAVGSAQFLNQLMAILSQEQLGRVVRQTNDEGDNVFSLLIKRCMDNYAYANQQGTAQGVVHQISKYLLLDLIEKMSTPDLLQVLSQAYRNPARPILRNTFMQLMRSLPDAQDIVLALDRKLQGIDTKDIRAAWREHEVLDELWARRINLGTSCRILWRLKQQNVGAADNIGKAFVEQAGFEMVHALLQGNPQDAQDGFFSSDALRLCALHKNHFIQGIKGAFEQQYPKQSDRKQALDGFLQQLSQHHAIAKVFKTTVTQNLAAATPLLCREDEQQDRDWYTR